MGNQSATKAINQALQTQDRVSQRREQTTLHIRHLFEKAEAIQVRIEETKTEWGVK